MKIRAISSIFCLIFSSQLSSAQILIGPAAGGQYSWISFDDKDNKELYKVKPVPGYHFGAALSFQVRKRFFLHTSFLYSTKGKLIEGKEDKLLKNRVRYNYIDVPVLYTVDFKAKIGKLKEFKYFLGIGPNISYWLGGKGKIASSDLSEDLIFDKKYRIAFNQTLEQTEADEMTIEDPNRIQLGLNLGAGLILEPHGFQKVMFSVRYELGHSFFSRTSNGLFSDTYYQDILRSRNQGVRVSIAYLVDLKVEDRKRGKSTIRRKNL